MSRGSVLLLPAALAAPTLPTTPALAREDGNDSGSGPDGLFTISFARSPLRVGAHHAGAVVWFAEGPSRARRTLRFEITRSPRFAG
jgi:hypothetical protein